VGIPFTVVPSRAEEILNGGDAVSLAQANALAKVTGASLPDGLPEGAFVLGTDTLVTVDGLVMGKPASEDQVREMLARLSGRVHQVVSGVALARAGASEITPSIGATRVANAVTDVTFVPLDAGQIEAYIALGEWKGKAGGYAVQGSAGLFVSAVHGEYSNVVGLPLCLVARLFKESGFDLVRRQWV